MLAQKHHIICTVALALLTISVALHSSQEIAYRDDEETGQKVTYLEEETSPMIAPAPLLVAKICAATWLRWQRAALLNDLNHEIYNRINKDTHEIDCALAAAKDGIISDIACALAGTDQIGEDMPTVTSNSTVRARL